MASSGSFEGSIQSGHYKIRVDWSISSQSVANNTSTVIANLYLVNDWSLNIGARTNEHYITINGVTTYLSSPSISSTGTHHIGSATTVITHNDDGTKSISISAGFAIKATLSSTYYSNITASTTVALTTIARASQPTLSATSVNFGNSITIYSNRASTSFTHHLYFSLNGGSMNAVKEGITDSYTWTVPASLMNYVTAATTATITIRLYTFNGDVNIGYKQVSFTATVPSSVKPSISAITCTDPTGYLTNLGGYIQSKSTCKIAVTASGTYSSTIKSYKIIANGTTYTANNSTTGVLKTAGTNTITVTVIDSRGMSATATTTITVLAYSPPTISTLTAVRCLSNGTEDADGAYMKITFGASITSLNNRNARTFIVYYKLQSASSYTVAKDFSSAYTVSSSVVIAADEDSSFDIRAVAADTFNSVDANVVLGTAFTLMDFRNTGKGISIGKVSESDIFECAMDAEITGALTVGSVKTDSGADLDTVAKNMINTIGYTANNTNTALLLGSNTVRLKVRRWSVALSGTSDVTISTGIAVVNVYDIRAYCTNTGNLFPLPSVGHSSAVSGHNNYDIAFYMDTTGTIHIKPYSDRSGYSAYITVYYI